MIASVARLPTCWSVCLGVPEGKPRKQQHLVERKTQASWFSLPSAAASCQAALRPLGSLEERSPCVQRCLESELVAVACSPGSLRDPLRADLDSGEGRSVGNRETRYEYQMNFIQTFNKFPADETRC